MFNKLLALLFFLLSTTMVQAAEFDTVIQLTDGPLEQVAEKVLPLFKSSQLGNCQAMAYRMKVFTRDKEKEPLFTLLNNMSSALSADEYNFGIFRQVEMLSLPKVIANLNKDSSLQQNEELILEGLVPLVKKSSQQFEYYIGKVFYSVKNQVNRYQLFIIIDHLNEELLMMGNGLCQYQTDFIR